jgi:hypothetical protein
MCSNLSKTPSRYCDRHRDRPPRSRDDVVSKDDDWSPEEPPGTEAFEPGDEAVEEESRINPGFLEEEEENPSLDPTLLVDERELEEAGAEFDDPEALATLDGGIDDPDGSGKRSSERSPGEGEGWDLDES